MDISITPVTNGWLVNNKTKRTKSVFVDREKLMEYLNDTIPPTGEENEFLDAIDDEGDASSYNEATVADMLRALTNQDGYLKNKGKVI